LKGCPEVWRDVKEFVLSLLIVVKGYRPALGDCDVQESHAMGDIVAEENVNSCLSKFYQGNLYERRHFERLFFSHGIGQT
jgi:hypothetical protein